MQQCSNAFIHHYRITSIPHCINFRLSNVPITKFHGIKDCEFRAGLTLTTGEAGLPLWTQSAYLAKQGRYSKSLPVQRFVYCKFLRLSVMFSL